MYNENNPVIYRKFLFLFDLLVGGFIYYILPVACIQQYTMYINVEFKAIELKHCAVLCEAQISFIMQKEKYALQILLMNKTKIVSLLA